MKKYINWLAYISLIIAFVIGYINLTDNKRNEVSRLEFLVENKLTIEEYDSETYSVQKSDSIVGYLAIGEAQGYGGPLNIVVFADTTGTIAETKLINSYESASFLAKLGNKKYYDQFIDKEVNNHFVIKKDLDAVSGATISSVAIAEATRDASFKIAENNLNLEIPSIERAFQFTYKEGIALFLFVLGAITAFLGKRKLRYVSLFLGLIFLGFMFNASLSITHFGRIILGYFPDIYTHFIWWLLMAGTITIIIGWGRNVYCSTLCPFHATQVLLNKISGINIKLSHKQLKFLNKTPSFLLWLSLVLIFLSSNPTLSSYEPFAMLFSLEGVGIQWYILPASLIGAIFFSNFFCRFFCPVGATFKWIQKRRKQVLAVLSKS